MDRYGSFAALEAGEMLGTDYATIARPRQSGVIVLAPHGGAIEPGTSEVAAAIAAGEHSLYCFEGLVARRPHGDLHITSERFDEPTGRRMTAAAIYAVAVHGRADAGDATTTRLGGLDDTLAACAKAELEAAGFPCLRATAALAGRSPRNICNATLSGAGLQLEIPRSLRYSLRANPRLMENFATALRTAITHRMQCAAA